LNLVDSSSAQSQWNTDNPNSVFEYLYDAKFGTFDAFIGMDSVYRVEDVDSNDGNFGFRFANATESGINYTFNFLNHYDPNPYIELSWENQAGTKLYENDVSDIVRLSTSASGTSNTVGGSVDSDGTAGSATGMAASEKARLVMTEKRNRITSIGASFDATIDAEALPLVLRGEFVYDKGVKTPVVTRRASDNKDLSHGFLTSSLVNEEADFFKYVIGLDGTVMTNLLVSGQFMQFRNLDYVSVGSGNSSTTWKYTADPAVMHLTNNLKQAKENKEFYSLFLSKPFGPNQLGRWNNIFMYEEDGGKWNRFDVEYSFSDELVGSFELNNYWGDANTQFGQMEDSSNIQVGLKYLF
jgi:hypothetical protein